MDCRTIAHIETDFTTKFGVPRQAGLIPELEGRIVFEPEYRVAEALRGLEGYSHLWLIWEFSEVRNEELGVRSKSSTDPKAARNMANHSSLLTPHSTFKATVRPPRLGGNKRMGVFATRSPFRPNPIGLSSVEISRIELNTPDGPILYIKGADLMNGTPILDIKPYLPFTDSHPEARGGFTDQTKEQQPLEVVIPAEALSLLSHKLGENKLIALKQVLSQDPRPHYQEDEDRIYGLNFAGEEIHFRVKGNILTVEIE